MPSEEPEPTETETLEAFDKIYDAKRELALRGDLRAQEEPETESPTEASQVSTQAYVQPETMQPIETQPATEEVVETVAQTEPQTELMTETEHITEKFAKILQESTEYVEIETATEDETEPVETETQPQSEVIYTAAYFKQAGVLNWGGSKWTWYTQRILPGEGLWIPGRHLDENGYVCDENGYICCAADLSYIPRYTVIETPLGKLGKIYDTGCAYGVIDVYTDW